MYAQVRLGAARRLEAQWGMQEDGGGSLDEQVHLLPYALCLMPYGAGSLEEQVHLLHLLHLQRKASHASRSRPHTLAA